MPIASRNPLRDHPLRGIRPWVWLTVAAAAAVACSGAEPVPSGVTAGSSRRVTGLEVRTASVWSGVERYCRLAATRTTLAIPCPTVAPVAAHPRSQWVMCHGRDNQLEGPGCPRQMFVLEEHFNGGWDYAGIAGPHGPLPVGHLAIWAVREKGADAQSCITPRLLQTAKIGSFDGGWYACTTGGLNAGHVAFVWKVGQVVYGVSLHRNSEVNRRLISTIVATLSIIRVG